MIKYTGCYSRAEIEEFTPPKDSALICIHDPDSHHPKVARIEQGWDRITFHRFWDVDVTNIIDNQKFEPASEKDLLWLKQALDWAKDQHCFVSCEAGISRSSAVREYLLRRGWKHFDVGQVNRAVHPNNHILASLERLDRKE